MAEYRVWIGSNDDYSGATEICIWKDLGEGRRAVCEPMEMKFRVVGEGEYVEKPSLRLPFHMSEPFFRAFAEALDRQGVKTESDAKIGGLLEATRYHLEDMRKLALRGV